jgi:hypothetical protein
MDNFRKVVANYKAWKLKEKKESGVTVKEIKKLREAYNKGNAPKVTEVKAKQTFKETLEDYRAWKLKEYKNDKISPVEFKKLRQEYLTEKKDVGNVEDRKLKEAVAKFSAWKQKKYNTSKVTEAEIKKLKARLTEKKAPAKEDKKYATINEAVLAYRQWKLKEKGTDKVSKNELLKIKESFMADLPEDIKLREQVKALKKSVNALTSKLREGDTAPAVDPAAMADPAAGGAVDAAADPNADPNAAPATPVDPAIQAQIQAVADAMSALETQVGIVPAGAGDMAAAPDAGVPPVDGTTPEADPNAAAAAPVAESKVVSKEDRIKAIRERLANREKKIQEAAAAQNEAQKVGQSAVITAGLPISVPELAPSQGTGSDTNPPSQLEQPALSKITGGVATGPAAGEMAPASTWPTKNISATGAKLAKVGEEVSYADRYLNEKLNEKKASWETINSFLSAGLLG